MNEPESISDRKLPFSATGQPRDYLRRLAPEAYRGRAFVHWSMSLRDRRTGWLTDLFHLRWREILLHTSARFGLVCPAYVLMPDHWHILWIGLREDSDQRKAAKFLREHTGNLLRESACELQQQAHDHVLREKDREHEVFMTVAYYIMANPERARITADWRIYPHSGALVPGYPSLDPRDADFWDRFWKIHALVSSPPR